ncbi:MAG: dihydroorotase [Ruminococcaceae bacterium]|nr:dihydroorotase [Oscillospiraceae bacterium]
MQTFENFKIHKSLLQDGVVSDSLAGLLSPLGKVITDTNEYSVFPGFCDVHVHFRQPGFSYKETIRTGTLAAAHGGYTAVCTMPNLNPVPDCAENMKVQTDIIRRDALINVYPYASITVSQNGTELSDMEALKETAVAFSDDGKGIQTEELMEKAMIKAKSLGKIIVAHCEDNSLLKGGYIHDGKYAREHSHRGICSESEWRQIKRDSEIAKRTGCAYHVCHISTKESVEIIRQAKKEGVNITCETAPHYLVLDENSLREDGKFKMNPPLRSAEDRLALIEGIKDGTVDMIATDHAPHSKEEKSKGLEKSAFGIVGLETAFPVLYTELVLKGIITLDRLIELMAINPRKRFGIPFGNDITVWKLGEQFTVNPDRFLSMGKATPFEGMLLNGKCCLTVCGGKTVYNNFIIQEA